MRSLLGEFLSPVPEIRGLRGRDTSRAKEILKCYAIASFATRSGRVEDPGVAIDLLAHKYRGDFPILEQKVNGFPLVYLDNAASTQHPSCVIDEISRYYRE